MVIEYYEVVERVTRFNTAVMAEGGEKVV